MITCPYCDAPAGRAYLSASHRWQHDCQACGKTSRARVAHENGKTVIIKLSAQGPRKRFIRTITTRVTEEQYQHVEARGGDDYIRMLIDNDIKSGKLVYKSV